VKVNVFNSSGQVSESTSAEGKSELGEKYAEGIYFLNLVNS
jgi:hypothetical protein